MSKEISSDTIENTAIFIRKAKPDRDEGFVFAQFFDEASEGFFTSMLGNKTYDILVDAYVKSNNNYSFENAFVIEYHGKVAGMISGYTSAERKGFNRKILSQFPNGAKFRIKMFSITEGILSRFLGPRGTEDYYIQAMAVSSSLRRKGIGQRLLKHIAEIAVKKGCKTLSLDVSARNEKAINSYHKFGMEVSSSWPEFLKLPPVFTRMEKKVLVGHDKIGFTVRNKF